MFSVTKVLCFFLLLSEGLVGACFIGYNVCHKLLRYTCGFLCRKNHCLCVPRQVLWAFCFLEVFFFNFYGRQIIMGWQWFDSVLNCGVCYVYTVVGATNAILIAFGLSQFILIIITVR